MNAPRGRSATLPRRTLRAAGPGGAAAGRSGRSIALHSLCVPPDAQLVSASQPARWGFYAWGAIYAYQGLGAFYALVPHGYGTNGVKERLVRVAGACWPFGWTCLLVWQVRPLDCDRALRRRTRWHSAEG